MIQDIHPHKLYNQFAAPAPGPDDVICLFDERKILCRFAENETLSLPKRSEFSADIPSVYLFSLDDTHYFLTGFSADDTVGERAANPIAPPDGYTFEHIYILRKCLPREIRLAGSTAYHLYNWYRDNQFCGRCGHLVSHSETERALACPNCGNMIFPKIAPAVIIGVTYGDKLLMSRYAGREYKGHALLAGFCEIGETAEETVAREVYEETKIHVKNIRFYKDQPWGFESDLLLGYYCELDGDPTITIDEEELAIAEWIPRDEITDSYDNMSLTNEMIIYFK